MVLVAGPHNIDYQKSTGGHVVTAMPVHFGLLAVLGESGDVFC